MISKSTETYISNEFYVFLSLLILTNELKNRSNINVKYQCRHPRPLLLSGGDSGVVQYIHAYVFIYFSRPLGRVFRPSCHHNGRDLPPLPSKGISSK